MSTESHRWHICIIQLWPGHHHHFSSRVANIAGEYADVTVVGANDIPAELYADNIKLVQLPMKVPMKYTFGELLKMVYYMVRLLLVKNSVLNKKNFSLFHIVYPHPCAYLLTFLYGNRIPVISDRHDIDAHPGEKNILRLIFDRLELHFQHSLCVHSRFGYEKIKSRNKLQNCFCIPHGDFNFISKTDFDCENTTSHVVLFFGRVFQYKGIETLIESIPMVIESIPDALFIFAGSGEWNRYEMQLEKILVKNRELHKTYIPDSNVAPLFTRSNVVVLPYHEASQSGVIPFAAACKRCVLATNVGGIPEVIHDNETGLLVEPKRSDMLAKALIVLLKDPHLRMRLANQLNKLFETDFSFRGLSIKYVDMYERVLKVK